MKAKYDIWIGKRYLQSYVTTTKTDAEIIPLLVDKYFAREGTLRIIKVIDNNKTQVYCSIKEKVIKEKREQIYRKRVRKVHKYKRKCIDMTTEQEFTIESLAKDLVMFRKDLSMLLDNPPNNFRYTLKP